MFNGVGWGEIAVLLVIGLFVFGPERLPKVARDAGRVLRQVRQMATGMREELRSELGPELADLDLRTLHPKTFVRKHLFEDDDPLLPPYMSKRTSFDKMLFDDGPDVVSGSNDLARPRLSYDDTGISSTLPSLTKSPTPAKPPSLAKAFPPDRSGQPRAGGFPAVGRAPAESSATPFDTDAT
ncbi:Sec-independent protein translocase protein TatB [Frankia sp. Cppng1_Ct_nod]|uniref:Sec-independent protein translocase protein TatB n=1 Tax=Frankia sp. Cppng1_Ct_nod TaxID=2897162 RepID=UPI00104105F7|nr:Sec-independent protein translocase protein TatB [Frankia sp. Cppng1_Ct_nod]